MPAPGKQPSRPWVLRLPLRRRRRATRRRKGSFRTALWVRFIVLISAANVAGSSGCTRVFWRLHADSQTYTLLGEKTADPRWAVPRLELDPDPQSRFFDPYDPDKEPLPPDDPAAHRSMHWLHGMRGYKCWHQHGDLFSVENPQWLAPFGLTPGMRVEEPYDDTAATEGLGITNLELEDAVELSYIHSRDYQTQLETMYLTALALTFEQFRFNVRFLGFGGQRPTSDLEYENIPKTQDSLTLNNRFGVSQLLPTGGQWIVELANNTLWLFSGENQTSTASVLSYSIVQPLLLNGGRKFALENLTQAERDALYAARDFARFRQTFFVDTVSGGGPNGGAYLGLLRLRQSILNQQYNIVQLQEQVDRFKALASRRSEVVQEPLPLLPEGLVIPPDLDGRLEYDENRNMLMWRGEMTPEEMEALFGLDDSPAWRAAIRSLQQQTRSDTVTLDVTQLLSRLANAQSNIIQVQRGYQDALDNYKIQLGLPPNLPVRLNLDALQPFELIDPRLTTLQDKIDEFVFVQSEVDADDPPLADLRRVQEGLLALARDVEEDGIGTVAADLARLETNWERRLASFPKPADQERVTMDVERDRQLFEGIREDFALARMQTADLAAELTEDAPLVVRKRIAVRIADLREEFLRVAQGLSVIQIGVRVELIELNPFDMPLNEAVEIALAERLDLMNARAVVMDARRREEVAANQLLAGLDIRVEGDVATRGIGAGNDNPFDFRGDASSYRAGVRFTAPLDQILQRNAYRATLIDYQRARRDYMAFEDGVKFSVRQDWRQVQVLRESFEISRQAVRFAALQYDQAVEQTLAPIAGGQARTSTGNQGLNLLNALNSVLQAQNDLIQNWVDYEANRLNIHRDMGIMRIDERGLWDDPYYQQGRSVLTLSTDASPNPPAIAVPPPLPALGNPDGPALDLPPGP